MSEEHKKYLRASFKSECPVDLLPVSCSRILARYGAWMAALANGEIQPLTKDQERFLSVHEGKCKPTTSFEIAWFRYRLECLYQHAISHERRLGNGGSVTYDQVADMFYMLACVGDQRAKDWLEEEGFGSINILNRYYSLRKFMFEAPTVETDQEGSVRSSFGPGEPTTSPDWSWSFDDMDSGDWWQIMGGPDLEDI